ncbi:MAG: nicotinate-nucleotide diphosphorylase (carboxylating), partial [Fusobacterium sp. JB020]|nr:nicotinate-nucleotide diphosphorylase (carboxylating) [Fusobacterium sp. JB020]
MDTVTENLNVDDLILLALKEDISSEDITTNSIIRENLLGRGELIAKEDGILAGIEIFKRVFK